MATRKNTFLLKRSNVAGNVPAAGQILLGELALNTADVKLYTSGTTANSILPIGWDRVSRTGDTMTGTLIVPTLSATTLTALNISGTTNYVAKFTTNGTSLGNSQIFDNGTAVGIGTTTPSQLLHVNGRALVNQFEYTRAIEVSNTDLDNLTNAGFYNGIQLTNAPGVGWYYITVERYTSDANWVKQTATSFGAGNTGNITWTRTRELNIWQPWKRLIDTVVEGGTTNYVPKFTGSGTLGNSQIFDNGTNVGIGTTSPTEVLDVNGALVTRAPRVNNLGEGGFIDYNNGEFRFVSQGPTTTAGSYSFTVRESDLGGSINAMFISNTGRVGIGTTGPNFSLDVNGDGRFQTNLTIGVTNNNNGARTVFNGSTSGRSFQIANNWNVGGSFEITPSTAVGGNTFTTPAFVLNGTTGNVGIGTTSPTQKLDVTGNIKISNNNSLMFRNAANNADIAILQLTNTNQLNIGTNSSSAPSVITLHTNSTEHMRITSTGNVGLNTIDPQAKLHVSGNTIISGDLTATTISATSIDQVNFVDINTGVTITSDAGRISWNDIDGTFNMGLYQGVSLQLGQEENMYGKAISGISNGDVVMFAGVQGDHVLFAKADPSVINQKPQYIIGVATQNFIANQFGYVTILGKVRNLNTSAYSDGTILYFNSTGSTLGGFTSVEPTAPNAKIIVAAVLRSHATQGVILVRPTFSRRVSDIQDVQITNIQNNDIIQYSSSLGYFVNTNTPKFSSVSATTMSAVTFTGNLTGLASLATSATTALNSTQLNGQSASYYYPSSNPSGYTTNTGTVTGVNSGNGMNFTNFTTSGTITLGTPSSLTLSSTNSVTTNSHTHAFAPGGTTAQYITGAGTLATFPTIVNTFVTGATFNSSNNNLTLTRNDGVNIVANLNISTTDVYVTGGTYSNGTATFKNNTGGTFNVTGFPTGATTAVSFTQTLPATGWTFTHNLGTDKPMITVYNSNNQVIIPQEITAISSSTLYITFPVPVAGYVIAGGGVVTQQTEEISIITAIIFG